MSSCPAAVRAPSPATLEKTLNAMRGSADPAQPVLEKPEQIDALSHDPVILQVRVIAVALLRRRHDGLEFLARDAELLGDERGIGLDPVRRIGRLGHLPQGLLAGDLTAADEGGEMHAPLVVAELMGKDPSL